MNEYAFIDLKSGNRMFDPKEIDISTNSRNSHLPYDSYTLKELESIISKHYSIRKVK